MSFVEHEHLNITRCTTTPSQWNEDEADFNAILQEFGSQVGIICALESGQKIPPKEAYQQIKSLFKQLKTMKRTVYPSHHKAS